MLSQQRISFGILKLNIYNMSYWYASFRHYRRTTSFFVFYQWSDVMFHPFLCFILKAQ